MTPFEISQDPRGFVRVTLRGYWSLEVLECFDNALHALIERQTAEVPLLLLMDGREQDVQSRELIEALQRREVRPGGVRVAVVIATMLRKLQAERFNPAADRAIFSDEQEALTWLLSSG